MLITPHRVVATRAWSEMNVQLLRRTSRTSMPTASISARYVSSCAAPLMQAAHSSALPTIASLS